MAELAGKVGDVDESDLLAAPKMIVHLRDRGDSRGRVLEGISTSSDWALRAWTRSSPTTDARLFLTRWLISRVSMAWWSREDCSSASACCRSMAMRRSPANPARN